MKYSFTDDQLLNLVNNTIENKTDFKPHEFTGGSVQITSTNNNQLMKYKVSLFFGYKHKNPISKTIDINEDLISIWIDAIHLKCKALSVANNGMSYSELNSLMNFNSQVVSNEVVSNEVVSNEVVSISSGITTSSIGGSNTSKGLITFCVDVVLYLNKKANTNFRTGIKKTNALIEARKKEGFTLEDFKAVIDKKSSQWLKDKKMCAFLRPETLFGSKFEGYLNENIKADINCWANEEVIDAQC